MLPGGFHFHQFTLNNLKFALTFVFFFSSNKTPFEHYWGYITGVCLLTSVLGLTSSPISLDTCDRFQLWASCVGHLNYTFRWVSSPLLLGICICCRLHVAWSVKASYIIYSQTNFWNTFNQTIMHVLVVDPDLTFIQEYIIYRIHTLN